jgi:hypothetical protein
METMVRPQETIPLVPEVASLKGRNRSLAWLSGILALAVVGLGIWLAVEINSDTADLTALQTQQLETVDAYMDAWNAGDGAAAVSLMTPTAYHDNGDTVVRVFDGELESLIDMSKAMGFSVSRTADVGFAGDFVVTDTNVPAETGMQHVSIFKMTSDGTHILWHVHR